MTTALDIITDALNMLGVYGPGDVLSAADAATGLSVLNDMVDSWSNENLTTFAYVTNSFTLIPSQAAYTIGTGGNINTTRPLKVSDGPGGAYLLDTNANKYMMDVVDQFTWDMRTTAAVNSNLPDTMFYDPQYPLGIINVWPTPNIGYTCYFLSWLQLGEFATLATVVTLPPGYVLAYKTNLAIALSPYFRDAAVNPVIVARAMESKGNVKRTNNKTRVAVFDPELVARGSSTYNIRSDRGA